MKPNMKRKIQQRRPRSAEQFKSCVKQEWDNVPLPQVQQLLSSVPRCLQAVVERQGDATQWETRPCPKF